MRSLHHFLEFFVALWILCSTGRSFSSGIAFPSRREYLTEFHHQEVAQWRQRDSVREARAGVVGAATSSSSSSSTSSTSSSSSLPNWADEFKCDSTASRVEKINSDLLEEDNVSETDPALSPPTHLQLEHISIAAVHLYWEYAPPTAPPTTTPTATPNHTQPSVQFLVQCSRDGGSYVNASDLLNATDYVFGMLCLAAEYQFQVLAYCGGVFSSPSQPSYFFLNGITAPAGPPTRVQAIVLGPRKVELMWDPPYPPPSVPAVYNIYWGFSPGNMTKKEVLYGKTHLSLSNLLSAHVYYFSLVADVSGHLSSSSEVVIAATPADLPPVKVLNSTVSSFWVWLAWSDPAPYRYPPTLTAFTVFFTPGSGLLYSQMDNTTLYNSTMVPKDSRSANVSDLIPGTEYVFRVRYSSERNYSSELSEAMKLRTLDYLVCSTCMAVNSTCLRISWETSLTRNQVLQSVSILDNTPAPHLVGYLLSSSVAVSYLIGRLHPWTEHSFSVAIGNKSSPAHLVSECPVTVCVTKEAAPSQPPLNFRLVVSAARAMVLAWDPPPPEARNGLITRYFLSFVCTHPTSWRDCNTTTPRVILAGDPPGVTVGGLGPYTQYWFQLAAETQAGKGPYTTLVNSTAPDAPTQPPTDVALLKRTETCLHFTWQPPDPWNRNGPITGYTVILGVGGSALSYSGTERMNVSEPEIEVVGLRPEMEYSVSVSAMTVVGGGPYSAPFAATTARSDLYERGSMDLNAHRMTTSRSNTCYVLAIKWSDPFISSANLSYFDRNITDALISYTLLFVDDQSTRNRSVPLGISNTTYTLAGQWLTAGHVYFVFIEYDVLLSNGSHLNFMSSSISLTGPDCSEGEGSSSIAWKVAVGISLGGSVLIVAVVLLTVCLLLKWRKQRVPLFNDVLMDTYRAGEMVEDEDMSPSLRKGDGAPEDCSDTEESRTPSPCSQPQLDCEAEDASSLGSSVGEEAPLLSQAARGGNSQGLNVLQHFADSLSHDTSPDRPLQLTLSSVRRLSPEGRSFSSSSSSSSPSLSSPPASSSAPAPSSFSPEPLPSPQTVS